MRIKDFFKRDNVKQLDLTLNDVETEDYIATRQDALSVPVIYGGVDLIQNIISSLEIKMYKYDNESVTEVIDDVRTSLLNDDTGNYMNGVSLKRAIVQDLVLDGRFCIYRNGIGKNTKSLHYIRQQDITFLSNNEPIFKEFKAYVWGKEYPITRFIIGLKNSTDGIYGTGLVQDCNNIIKQGIETMSYVSGNITNGGIKRGVIQSKIKLSEAAITHLKAAWANLYKGNNDCIILNDGLEYKELQQTSSELQLNENKSHIDSDINNALNIPGNLLNSQVPDDTFQLFVKICIVPLLSIIENALNKTLLTTDEKGVFYFAFDTKDINKADIEKRFKAYEIAIKNSIMSPSEVRYKEDLSSDDRYNIIKLNLADVLMDKDGNIYTPNMDVSTNMTQSDTQIDEGQNMQQMEGGE